MSFDETLEEAMGFGTSSYMELDDLRRLYYGRKDIYVSFTDDGEQDIKSTGSDVNRPDSIVCYKINDVIGRKATTSEFYANVFRINKSKGNFIDDISYYDRDDLETDILELKTNYFDRIDQLEEIERSILSNRRVRSPFGIFWTFTEAFSKTFSNSGREWRKMLMELGYTGFSDPKGSGLIGEGRTPTTIYLDYGSRVDLDILPIQKFRIDPRARVRLKVDRMVARMAPRRVSISKRRTRGSGGNDRNKMSFSDTLRLFQDLL